MKNSKRWLLAGLGLSLAVAGIIFFTPLHRPSSRQRATPPDSLSAYVLKAEDRQMLAEWGQWHRHGPPDSLREWVRQHYGPFQSLGLRLLEQAALFRGGGKMPLAAAKFDTAREIGEALADAAQDSFLLQQLRYLKQLDEINLRRRNQAAIAFAAASDSLNRNNAAARPKFAAAAALAKQIHDDKLYLDAMYYLLYFLDQESQYQTIVEMSGEILTKAEHCGYQSRLALTLYRTAGAHKHLHHYREAQALLDKAISIAARLRDNQILARCYKSQADVYYFTREYQRTENTLQKLIATDKKNELRGFANHLQGQIYNIRGKYSQAQTQYELALDFFRNSEPGGLNVAWALNSLSGLKLMTGDYAEALKLGREALLLCEATKNPEEIAESLSRSGFIYYKMDSLDQAIYHCQRALALFPTRERNTVASTWLILGNAQLRKKNIPAAIAALANTKDIAPAIQDQILVVEAEIGYGQVKLLQELPAQAKTHFLSALTTSERLQDPILLADALLGLAKAEQKLKRWDRAREAIERAIITLENVRSGIRQDSVRISYFATTQELFDQAIVLAQQRQDGKLALHYAERARARALRDVLSGAVEDIAPDQLARLNNPIPDFKSLQNSIPTSVQVVEYRVLPDTLLIWLLDREKLVSRGVAVSRQTLERLIDEYRTSLGAVEINTFKSRVDQSRQGVYDENRRLGRQLYQLLWGAIADAVAPQKRLFIIPDGILHRLPFGALVTPDEYFFDEKYIWVKAPSLTILAKNFSHPAWPRQAARFLMVADDLPSVSAQQKFFSRLFVHSSFLMKQAATFAALQERLRAGVDIAYFSVHAIADAQFPLNSYIELYGAEGTNGHARKTKIYARELLQLNFAETRLTVLNACETATGKIAAGEGVLNLVRIFALKKVPIVIASLWRNDDRYSAQITGDFFSVFASAPDQALALHQAKLNAIRKLQKDYGLAFPYFWAAFEVYQNNWEPLQK